MFHRPSSRRAHQLNADFIEALEARRLLAGTTTTVGGGGSGAGGGTVGSIPLDISAIPVFHATTSDLSDLKTGPLANIGSHLADIYLTYRHAVKSNGTFVNNDSLVDVQGDLVAVDLRIRTTDLNKFVKGLVAGYGFIESATNLQYSVAEGYLPINWLRTVAARADIAQLTPVYKPVLDQQGIANNQGDVAEKADIARTDFNLDGTGVKVGVISDSASRFEGGIATSIASGDLPADAQVLVDGESGDTDEGRAMMEEIHDIAPGAKLAFATGDGGIQKFADDIALLKANGATVIVDDLTYFTEPMFQEGILDTAINTAVAAGATYLSSAGNDSDSGLSHTLSFTTVDGRTLADFGGQTRFKINIDQSGTMIFGWDEPYNGLVGSAQTDLDIRFYASGTNNLKAESLDDNLASGVPLELFFAPKGTYDVEIEEAQHTLGAPQPAHFVLRGHEVDMTTINISGSQATSFGHNGSNAVISVGAVPFFSAPPFSTFTPVDNEEFSSRGGQVYYFDNSGNRLSSPVVTQKPDVSGIDGINTSFFGDDISQDSDNLPNFFGTSAAAPNVAAIVALIKQATPNVTQAEVVAGLKATAHALNGTTQGNRDSIGGYGLVDADLAIPAFASTPTVQIQNIVPNPRGTPVSSITITFNQIVSGFSIGDLTLRNNFGANLLTGGQTLSTTDHITYTLNNLSTITMTNGTYRIVLNAAGAGVTNLVGGALTTTAVEAWTKTDPPPVPNKPTGVSADAISSNAINLTWNDNNTSEDEYVVQRALDPNFTASLKTFHVAKNSTSLLSTGLTAGTRYYFRVRASNSTAPGSYSSTVFALTRLTGEIIVDNSSPGTLVTGFWGSSTTGNDFIGTDYLQDGNSAKGTKIVRYSLPLQASGSYYVYAHWTNGPDRSTNTPFDITYGVGSLAHTTILMNQRDRGGAGWTLIGGPFFMDKTTGASVRIRNAGTNGTVVADAIRLIPEGPLNFPQSYIPSKSTMPLTDDSQQKKQNAGLFSDTDILLL